MCEPVTAAFIVAGASVAATAGSVVGQIQTAKAQSRALNDQLAVTNEEDRRQKSVEIFDRMREARREQARIRTAAGEAGLSLSSGSVEALLMDSAFQAQQANERSIANLESRNRANKAEAKVGMSNIVKPTLIGAGLQIGAAAAQGAAGVSNARAATKPPG